jgi:hypothetical protein
MDSKLFAFRVAQPMKVIPGDPVEFRYDPQSQTAVWTGGSQALATLQCTGGVLGGAAECLIKEGIGCYAIGGATIGYNCDV